MARQFRQTRQSDPVGDEAEVPEDMQLPKHHHSGAVMVYTLSGKWRYLEHDWSAGPGSSVFETAGTQHTPVGCGEGEIVTLNCHRTDTKPVDITSFASRRIAGRGSRAAASRQNLNTTPISGPLKLRSWTFALDLKS